MRECNFVSALLFAMSLLVFQIGLGVGFFSNKGWHQGNNWMFLNPVFINFIAKAQTTLHSIESKRRNNGQTN